MKKIESSETPVYLFGNAWHQIQKAALYMSVITSYGFFVRAL
jgi:hypothetical protein